MSEESQIEINEEVTQSIKKKAGRPRKYPPVEKKPKREKKPPVVKGPIGRPKKYEHRYSKKYITYEEYDRLREIEQKYLKIIEIC